MPLSKGVIAKRRTAPISKNYVKEQVQIMEELGLPDEFINRWKIRIKRCKTQVQAESLATQMKLDYFLGEEWEP